VYVGLFNMIPHKDLRSFSPKALKKMCRVLNCNKTKKIAKQFVYDSTLFSNHFVMTCPFVYI
jgi:hypothetical protein